MVYSGICFATARRRSKLKEVLVSENLQHTHTTARATLLPVCDARILPASSMKACQAYDSTVSSSAAENKLGLTPPSAISGCDAFHNEVFTLISSSPAVIYFNLI
jgi:hypothetical protein